MLTFAGLVDHARAFDAETVQEKTRRFYEQAVRGALDSAWNGRTWPFHRVETALPLYGPYVTGTVTLTEGLTTCVHSGTGFLHTVWPTPAWLKLDGREESYLINSFNSTSSATLDTGFRGTSGAYEFRIEFPCYDLPTDLLTMQDPVLPPWRGQLTRFSYPEWLVAREQQYGAGYPTHYATKEGDGIREPSQLCLFPAPDVDMLSRLIYRSRSPAGIYWAEGTATTVAADATVTGVGTTLWNSCGFTVPGLVMEFPTLSSTRRMYGTVLSVTNDNSLELTANWTYQAITSGNYVLSEQLRFPDHAAGFLQSLVAVEVCKVRRDWDGTAYFTRMAAEQEKRLAAAAGRTEAVREIASLIPCDDEKEGNYSIYPLSVEVS